jgi:hypothetical protein
MILAAFRVIIVIAAMLCCNSMRWIAYQAQYQIDDGQVRYELPHSGYTQVCAGAPPSCPPFQDKDTSIIAGTCVARELEPGEMDNVISSVKPKD